MKSPSNKKILGIILIGLFVIQPILFLSSTKKVHAVVPVLDLPNLTQNTVTSRTLISLWTKELVFDGLATKVAKIAINVLTESVVNWINTGFDGNPAFVTDFGGFLREIADRETSLFIEGSALELLCSPWKLNIKVALSQPTGYRKEVACTLSDIVANMDSFVKGDFQQGGWGGWFQLTTRPNNNPYSLYISAASEIDSRIARQQGLNKEQLAWGKGFLSKQVCDPAGSQNCKTVTPGTVIEDTLTHVLGSGVRQLELADEFNEIVSALLNQLIQQSMNGLRGLRGASQSTNGKTSLTSQIGNSKGDITLSSIKEQAVVGIDRDINNETDYRNVKQLTLNSILASEVLLLNVTSCYAGKLAGSLTNANKGIAQARIGTASSTIATQITPIKTSVEIDINNSNQNLGILNAFKTNITNASSAEVLNSLVNDLNLLRLNGNLDISDIFNAQQQQGAVTVQMSSLNTTTSTQITECQNFPPPVIVLPTP